MRMISRIVLLSAALLCLSLHVVPVAAAGELQDAPKAHMISTPEERVDINHASVAELMKVQGMTRTWAGRIVRFRPYRAKNDLLDRGVVTSQVYSRIKDYIIAHRDRQ